MAIEKVYTSEERTSIKNLREVLAAIDREPELPGGMPAEVRRLLSIDPETVLRSVVKLTKSNIRTVVDALINSMGEYKNEG